MFDLLVYLFEYHQVADGANSTINSQAMTEELQDAGFTSEEISGAFGWLEGLVEPSVSEVPELNSKGMRHFSVEEKKIIPIDARAFILNLELVGVLDAPSREFVIDRLLALQVQDIDADHVRWVVLMVLCNHAKYNEVIDWAESMMSGEQLLLH